MEQVPELIKKYLQQGKVMQVATVADGQPWVCTVYYVADEHQNVYWLSLPTRRHSKELMAHSKVAVAFPIKLNQPVIGLQAQGIASTVTDKDEVARIMKLYVERYSIGKAFYRNIVAGTNQHKMYRFTPEMFVLFDEVTFAAEASRKEWLLVDSSK